MAARRGGDEVIWKQATAVRLCGSCRAEIASGTPVLLVSSAQLPRCVKCAQATFGAEPPSSWPETPVPKPAPQEQPFATPRGWAGRKRELFDARMAAAEGR